MHKTTLYIFCGLPFSGKTTLANAIRNKANLVFVSIDDIKIARGFTWTEDENISAEEWQEIFADACQKTKNALKTGRSVLYDSANQTLESRDKLRQIAKECGAEAIVIFMNIPEKIVEERWQNNRETAKRFHLPERFFRAAFSNYEPPAKDENIIVFHADDSAIEWIEKHFS